MLACRTPALCRGMFGTIGTVAKEEGAAALWKGIAPGLHRQCLFGGLRIGLYEPVSNACCWQAACSWSTPPVAEPMMPLPFASSTAMLWLPCHSCTQIYGIHAA